MDVHDLLQYMGLEDRRLKNMSLPICLEVLVKLNQSMIQEDLDGKEPTSWGSTYLQGGMGDRAAFIVSPFSGRSLNTAIRLQKIYKTNRIKGIKLADGREADRQSNPRHTKDMDATTHGRELSTPRGEPRSSSCRLLKRRRADGDDGRHA